MKQHTGYKYRLYPTKEQQLRLAQLFGSVRWTYNYTINRKQAVYAETKKSLSRFAVDHEIVELKKQEGTSWLKEVNAQSLCTAVRNADSAYTNFFKGLAKFPRFKSKKSKNSAHFPQHSRLSFEDKTIYLTTFKEGIKGKFHRTFNGTIKNVVVSRAPTGRYYASVLIEEEVPPVVFKPLAIERAVGIDLGIKSFAVVSNGVTIDNPKYYKKSLPKLKKAQQRLSKKRKGSQNYKKQRVKVAKAHERITNQRLDFLHKQSRLLVNDSQIDTYCLETLNIKGMKKNHCLAQSVSDCGWNEFTSFISYKAARAGKNVLRVDRWAATSKTCNVCGTVTRALTLKDREWVCPSCGATHDRDFLAACNIRDFAFKVPSERRDVKPVEIRTSVLGEAPSTSPVYEAGSPSV